MITHAMENTDRLARAPGRQVSPGPNTEKEDTMRNRNTMTSRWILTSAGVALCALVIAGCTADRLTGPRDATAESEISRAFDVHLASHDLKSGALLFTVSGATIDSITSSTGSVFTIDGAAEGLAPVTRAVFSGDVDGGVIATLWVRGAGSTPVVTLQQAMARGSLASEATEGYSLAAVAR